MTSLVKIYLNDTKEVKISSTEIEVKQHFCNAMHMAHDPNGPPRYKLCIEYGKFRGIEMEYHTYLGCRQK